MNDKQEQYGMSREAYVAVRATQAGATVEQYLEDQRRRIVDIARSLAAGNLGVIEGVRLLNSLDDVYTSDSDPDLLVFIGVDSQTDHFAIGGDRAHWSAEALARQDIDLCEAEEFFRETIISTCERVIARFGRDRHSADE